MASPGSAFKFPGSPGMPLFSLSPERVNSHRISPVRLPQSPSLPDLSPAKHLRTTSDVQGLVARFNTLDVKDHAELRKKDEAALKRAQLGREEAESETRKAKEDAKTLKKEIEEAKDQEQTLMKHLDVVNDQLHRAKETQSVAQGLYEKEIRRAKKEAFKSSSALVKLQEELKAARASLQGLRSDLDLEKRKAGAREQDTFKAQYELVGVQEELAQSKSRIKVMEEERDTLKTNLKEEEVARIAAEGRIALPPSKEEDDEFCSPKKRKTKNRLSDKENAPPKYTSASQQLNEELDHERRRRQEAEEQIEFMKMECQFQCCSCRVAEQQGSTFVYDSGFEEEMQKIKSTIAASVASSTNPIMPEQRTTSGKIRSSGTRHEPMPVSGKLSPVRAPSPSAQENHSPNFSAFASPKLSSVRQTRRHEPLNVQQNEPLREMTNFQGQEIPAANDPPKTPLYKEIQLVTKTTTVPLAAASETDYSAFFSPNGLTREEAIELLRERRGRARSVAGTPKKTPNEKSAPRRDISAPEIRNEKTPRSVSRGKLQTR